MSSAGNNISGPRVYDGHEWYPVVDGGMGHTGSQGPVPPTRDGNGKIFVSLPSFRDGERCAETIKSLYDNAKHPENIIVGIIEETEPNDKFCLEVYCQKHGVSILQRQTIRADMTKVMATEDMTKCPYVGQIRLVARYNVAAKGPSDARALTRKIVGNEEYCMQIDAHSAVTDGWDDIAKDEWYSVGNEFAIISTVPAKISQRAEYESSSSWTTTGGGSMIGQVPRQCMPKLLDTHIPDFASPADGKAMNLERPLLSRAWSAAFSFSKCHIEETAPYDPFTPYIMSAEQFPRFARFWTRGYDVYTPTRNIVYHDYSPSSHGIDEWFKRRRGKARQESLARIKSFLHLRADAQDVSDKALANLGIYGLGKRRSLKQLMDFAGIDLNTVKVDRKKTECANLEWVPYDASISPTANLYEDADDLDPQPEFPLRTELTFYEEIDQPVGLQIDLGQDPVVEHKAKLVVRNDANEIPVFTIFVLWMFGLVVWCVVFVHQGGTTGVKKSKRRKNKTRATDDFKDV